MGRKLREIANSVDDVAVADDDRKAAMRAQPNGNVLEWWADRFPFAEVYNRSAGHIIGYGVKCGLHINEAGGNTEPCKKMITIGQSGMSADEARQRLKRWLIAGATGHLEDPTMMRQSHIKFGGQQLKHLGSDVEAWGSMSEGGP